MSKFAAVCHCVKHEEWFYREATKEDLRVASRDEVLCVPPMSGITTERERFVRPVEAE